MPSSHLRRCPRGPQGDPRASRDAAARQPQADRHSQRHPALGVFKQAVLVLRWFVDGTRLVQLARDNGIAAPTACRYLHEGLTLVADHARLRYPMVHPQ